LAREYPDANGSALANVVLNAYVNQAGEITVAAADAAREAGNSPNTVLSSAVAIIGPNKLAGAKTAATVLKDLFSQSGLSDASDDSFDISGIVDQAVAGDAAEALLADSGTARSEGMLAAIEARGVKSVFINFLKTLADRAGKAVAEDAISAAVGCHVTWKALMHKRVSVTTLVNMPWHFRIFSTLVGSSAPGDKQKAGNFCGFSDQKLMNEWSFTETAHLALLGTKASESELFSLSILLGLLTTNGPGTISGQGAKGAVSADGPEVPDRVQVNKSYIGFLTHTGYAHGGNGFEAMSFLMEQFKESKLKDPGDKNHGLDLPGMALAYAKEYKAYKTKAKAAGELSYAKIPCINHPVFKGKDVNYDPREVFVNDLIKGKGEYNIFLDYYHNMVEALAKTGVSKNVYCVNVDAVIAVILLKMLWQPFAEGKISERQLESAAFTTFLYGRMIGSAAEIDDHTNRGRNMDTRTPASKVVNVG